MATSGNDKITVTNGVNAGAAGDDTYILSPASFVSATNAKIKISDTQGSNTIQLNGGLQIVKSVVASHTTMLTLNNGAEVTVLGADTFNYITADNAGVAIGTSQKYGNFATSVLSTTVPAASAAGVKSVLMTKEDVAVVIKTDGTGVTAIPLVKLTASAASVNEGNAVTYTATLSSAAPVGGLNVPYTLSGTANSADYTTTSTGTINIAAGLTTGTLVLNAVADNLTEGAEAVTVTLGQGTIPSTTAIVASTAVSTTINDTSLVPVAVTLTANATAVNEGAAVTYMATAASAAPAGGWSIPYTLGGAATTPADYTTTSTGTINIAAGQTVGTLVLNAVADSLTEGAEAVTVALGSVAGLAVSPTPLSATINDASTTPAGTPTVTLTASPTSVNEGSAVTYTATLTGGTSTTALSIPYTLGGTATATADYTTSASTITIAAGQTTGTLVLSAVADNLTETAPEVVTVALLNTVTGVAINSVAVSTAINDTSLTPVVVLPTVTLSSNAAAAGINEGAAVIYTATLTSAAPATGLSIPYTLSGTGIALGDFTPALTALTGNITIAAGATTGSVTLTTANDLSTSEGAETLAITLGVATGVTLGTTTTVSTLIADTSTATVNGLISQAVSAAGSVDADTLPSSNVQFDFTAGKYAYTIANFGKGDVLNFPGDINPTINNISGTDGNIDVQWADGGSLVVVTLTGLTTAQDTPIYSLGSFNGSTTGFGAGSII